MTEHEQAAFRGARSVRRTPAMPPRHELAKTVDEWTPLTRCESIVFWVKHIAVFAVAALVLWAVAP